MNFNRQVAILDACVLYPAPIRDLLLHLANLDLYIPKWSEEIQEEWIRNLLLNRPDIHVDQLQQTKAAMNRIFPDANILNYNRLKDSVHLPDKDDNHVLSAAILCDADIIITANLKDFPNQYLAKFDILAQHPDFFISNLINLNPKKASVAFNNQVSFLKNPPLTVQQVLTSLKSSGLEQTVNLLTDLVR